MSVLIALQNRFENIFGTQDYNYSTTTNNYQSDDLRGQTLKEEVPVGPV